LQAIMCRRFGTFTKGAIEDESGQTEEGDQNGGGGD
jgi:hypothetical protein